LVVSFPPFPEETDEKIYEELVRIRSLLERLVRKELKEELENIASTNERKMIWALCDGMNNTTDIASKVGISQRAVQIFIGELMARDLVKIEKRGYPRRKYEYMPEDWQIRGEHIE